VDGELGSGDEFSHEQNLLGLVSRRLARRDERNQTKLSSNANVSAPSPAPAGASRRVIAR
jgi:hypothetical protein